MNPDILEGRTILITGATIGIGEALTRYLMQHDVRLILVARTREKLEVLQRESLDAKANVSVIVCDLSNEQNTEQLCAQLQNTHIDFFVSNAGKTRFFPSVVEIGTSDENITLMRCHHLLKATKPVLDPLPDRNSTL